MIRDVAGNVSMFGIQKLDALLSRIAEFDPIKPCHGIPIMRRTGKRGY